MLDVYSPRELRSSSWLYCLALVYAVSVIFVLSSSTRPGDNFEDESVTYVHDKYVCVQFMFTVHMICTWSTFLMGLFSLLSRLFEFSVFFHKWLGKGYVMAMVWTCATSGLIRNEGLPSGTIISFAWVLGGLTFGWLFMIVARDKRMHGALMFTSWFGIAGRIFNYNLHKDFKCYTYPVFKPFFASEYSNQSFALLSSRDPRYDSLPWAHREVWGWGVPLLLGPLFGFLLLSLCFRMAS